MRPKISFTLALALSLVLSPSPSPLTPQVYPKIQNLAEVLRGQGKYDEAERWFRRALDIVESTFGLAHEGTLG